MKGVSFSDKFWPGFEITGRYTKQSCFLDHPDLEPTMPQAREKYKAWYKSQKEYWGRGASKAYARWKSDHNEQVSEFLENFRKAYNYLAKKNNLPKI